MNDPRNIQGLTRDCYLAYEHFEHNMRKTLKYAKKEFRESYTEQEIDEAMDRVAEMAKEGN